MGKKLTSYVNRLGTRAGVWRNRKCGWVGVQRAGGVGVLVFRLLTPTRSPPPAFFADCLVLISLFSACLVQRLMRWVTRGSMRGFDEPLWVAWVRVFGAQS